jgi:hypothetical protein
MFYPRGRTVFWDIQIHEQWDVMRDVARVFTGYILTGSARLKNKKKDVIYWALNFAPLMFYVILRCY